MFLVNLPKIKILFRILIPRSRCFLDSDSDPISSTTSKTLNRLPNSWTHKRHASRNQTFRTASMYENEMEEDKISLLNMIASLFENFYLTYLHNITIHCYQWFCYLISNVPGFHLFFFLTSKIYLGPGSAEKVCRDKTTLFSHR